MSIFSGIGTGIESYLNRKRTLADQQKREQQGERGQALELFKMLLGAPANTRPALQSAVGSLFPNVKISGEWPTEPSEALVDIPGVGRVPISDAHKWQNTILEPGRRAAADKTAGIQQGHLDVAKGKAILDEEKFVFDQEMRRAAQALNERKLTSEDGGRAASLALRKAAQGWLQTYQTLQIALQQGRFDLAAKAQADLARYRQQMVGISGYNAQTSRMNAETGRMNVDPKNAAWDAFFTGTPNPAQQAYIKSQLQKADPQTAQDITIATRLGAPGASPQEQALAQAALKRLAAKYKIPLPTTGNTRDFLQRVIEFLFPPGTAYGTRPITDSAPAEPTDELDDLYR